MILEIWQTILHYIQRWRLVEIHSKGKNFGFRARSFWTKRAAGKWQAKQPALPDFITQYVIWGHPNKALRKGIDRFRNEGGHIPKTARFPWDPHSCDDPRGNPCQDCGVDTLATNEIFSVYNHVWFEVKDNRHGFLCVGCLEDRLHRELTPIDFDHLGVNEDPTHPRSERLISRLGPVVQLNFDKEDYMKGKQYNT